VAVPDARTTVPPTPANSKCNNTALSRAPMARGPADPLSLTHLFLDALARARLHSWAGTVKLRCCNPMRSDPIHASQFLLPLLLLLLLPTFPRCLPASTHTSSIHHPSHPNAYKLLPLYAFSVEARPMRAAWSTRDGTQRGARRRRWDTCTCACAVRHATATRNMEGTPRAPTPHRGLGRWVEVPGAGVTTGGCGYGGR
jgi:hypothetical protein